MDDVEMHQYKSPHVWVHEIIQNAQHAPQRPKCTAAKPQSDAKTKPEELRLCLYIDLLKLDAPDAPITFSVNTALQ